MHDGTQRMDFIELKELHTLLKLLSPRDWSTPLKISSIQSAFACLRLDKLKQAQVQIDC